MVCVGSFETTLCLYSSEKKSEYVLDRENSKVWNIPVVMNFNSVLSMFMELWYVRLYFLAS